MTVVPKAGLSVSIPDHPRSLLHFTKFFLVNFFFIKVWWIYNVVLISAVQQIDPVKPVYPFPFLYYLPSWCVPISLNFHLALKFSISVP